MTSMVRFLFSSLIMVDVEFVETIGFSILSRRAFEIFSISLLTVGFFDYLLALGCAKHLLQISLISVNTLVVPLLINFNKPSDISESKPDFVLISG